MDDFKKIKKYISELNIQCEIINQKQVHNISISDTEEKIIKIKESILREIDEFISSEEDFKKERELIKEFYNSYNKNLIDLKMCFVTFILYNINSDNFYKTNLKNLTDNLMIEKPKMIAIINELKKEKIIECSANINKIKNKEAISIYLLKENPYRDTIYKSIELNNFQRILYDVKHRGYFIMNLMNLSSMFNYTEIGEIVNRERKSIGRFLEKLCESNYIKIVNDKIYFSEDDGKNIYAKQVSKTSQYVLNIFKNNFRFKEFDLETIRRERSKRNSCEGSSFLETDLEKYLSRNLSLIEENLKLIATQYSVTNGRIDILGRDTNNTLVIIELKIVGDDSDLIFQSTYYPACFDEPTRMITICPNYHDKILKALNVMQHIEKFKYTIKGDDFKTLSISKL